MSLIGLDIGTTGCKCTVFEEQGNVLSYAYQEYPLERPAAGHAELNPENVWNAACTVIKQALSECPSTHVAALSISSIGEAAIPVDRQGRALANSILCTDVRGAEECQYLEEILGRERIMDLTGIPPHPMYTICKVMWIKRNQPEIFNNAWKFLLFEDYIIYRLTGETVIDYSLAARTMAFNVVEKKWAAEIFEAASIDPGLFSKPALSGTPAAVVKPQLARELGLSSETLAVTGGHDQICAAVGGGILSEKIAVDGIGTVECITPAFGQPLRNPQMMKNNFNCAPHALEGLYATYAFNFTGGGLLKWFRDCFARHEKEEAAKSGGNVYAQLDQQAPREPTSLLVLPHFAGAGTPYMNPQAQGAILGLTFDHTQADVYRAMLEGVTYEMAYNMECLNNAGIIVDSLRAVGGGAKSDLWLQIKADIMQRPVERLNVDEAGTLGTAILAGTAAGVYNSLEEATAQLVTVKQTFLPDSRNREIYQRQYQRYKQIYPRINDI